MTSQPTSPVRDGETCRTSTPPDPEALDALIAAIERGDKEVIQSFQEWARTPLPRHPYSNIYVGCNLVND